MRARCGAVDFVGENDLCKERSGTKFEGGGFRIEDRTASDVVGQQVGSALNALKRAANAARKGTGEHGFGHAGNVLEQHVSLGKISHEHQDDLLVLIDDGALDILNDPVGERRDGGFARRPRRWIDGKPRGQPNDRVVGVVEILEDGAGAAIGTGYLLAGIFIGELQVLSTRATNAFGHHRAMRET